EPTTRHHSGPRGVRRSSDMSNDFVQAATDSPSVIAIERNAGLNWKSPSAPADERRSPATGQPDPYRTFRGRETGPPRRPHAFPLQVVPGTLPHSRRTPGTGRQARPEKSSVPTP